MKAYTVLILVAFLVGTSAPGVANDGPATQTAVPDSSLAAGGFHRFWFGDGYRDIWTTTIEVPLLDLSAHAGGLTPTGTGSGMQSLGLRFVGANGRPFSFRPLRKTFEALLPEAFRGTVLLNEIAADQLNSAFPTAPAMVPVLLDAVDVLHVTPKICVIPDDPRLGEYRLQFRGVLGSIEEWPNELPGGEPGFAGATSVVDSEELIEILRADPAQRVDATNLLAARLIDLLIGDWDRHAGQWRWANVGEGSPPAWRPVPEDRDQAFARYDGLLMSLARNNAPQLTNYGPEYGSILGLTWNGQHIDRRHLAGLGSAVWDSVVATVGNRITDEVIDAAVSRLPDTHRAREGERVTACLRSRRDRLPEIADEYYRHLSGEIDLHLTDGPEAIHATRRGDGHLELVVRAENADQTFETYRRTFAPDDTDDVRLFLHGGDDTVDITGAGPAKVAFHIISDEGADRVTDVSDDAETKVYDSRRENGAVVAGASLDSQPFTPPPPQLFALPPRDWGHNSFWTGVIDLNGDVGLVLGAGLRYESYSFRRQPFNWMVHPSLAISTKLGRFRFRFDSAHRGSNPRLVKRFDVMVSGMEAMNYFGLGNETAKPDDSDLSDVQQMVVTVDPAVDLDLGSGWDLGLGAQYRFTDTREDETTIIGVTQPYGVGKFSQAGIRLTLNKDDRDRPVWPTRGWFLETEAAYVPTWLEVDQDEFGWAEGEIAGVVPLSRKFMLVGRLGGRKVWGTYPYFEAATIGGSHSVRAYQKHRFAGDASILGTIETRIALGRMRLFVTEEIGVLFFADSGRVWLAGEDSSRWHSGAGGGIWVAPYRRELTMTLTAAYGDEGLRVYFGFGIGF